MIPDPRRPSPELVAVLKEGCSGQSGGVIFSQANDYDYREALARLQVPALVMMGDADPLDVGWVEETERALSRAKVRRVIIPNCGHFPYWEQPDRFFSELRAFLSTARMR
jgi:pimeloyl-ACP methyl ester carboxylesterase